MLEAVEILSQEEIDIMVGTILVSNQKVDKPQIITVNGKPKFEGEVVIVDGEYYGYKITGVIE